MAIWSRLTGAIAAIGIADAGSAAIEPVIEVPKQDAWKAEPNRILVLDTLAQLVTQGLIARDAVVDHAARNGYTPDKLDALIQLHLRAPTHGEVLELWRRGKFGTTDPENPPEQVTHSFAKEQLEEQYWKPLAELFFERLSVQDVAVMVQRGILPNPGWLPVGPPTETGRVPPMPQASFDPVAEAQSQGFDPDRASALAKIIGLPASPDLAARMTFRDIIDRVDFDRAISEGNTRNEWAPFLFDGFREILTAHDYTELELRGFSTRDQRLADTSKHGMSEEDSDKLYDVLGRAPSIHTLVVGLARGGKYPGSYANVPEPFRSAIQRSNIREEWAEVVYAARYNYPSGFQIRSEAKAGDLDAATTKELLLEVGWDPKWAEFFSNAWTGAATAKPLVSASSAESKAARAVLSAYTAVNITKAKAEEDLTALGIDAAEQGPLFAAADVQRQAKLQGLSNTQIRNAYRKAALTQDEALPLLEAHGLDATAALAYLTA